MKQRTFRGTPIEHRHAANSDGFNKSLGSRSARRVTDDRPAAPKRVPTGMSKAQEERTAERRIGDKPRKGGVLKHNEGSK
jgi:hypothetical protein